jgi:hypothetical protein
MNITKGVQPEPYVAGKTKLSIEQVVRALKFALHPTDTIEKLRNDFGAVYAPPSAGAIAAASAAEVAAAAATEEAKLYTVHCHTTLHFALSPSILLPTLVIVDPRV